jgi:hypothetical protein
VLEVTSSSCVLTWQAPKLATHTSTTTTTTTTTPTPVPTDAELHCVIQMRCQRSHDYKKVHIIIIYSSESGNLGFKFVSVHLLYKCTHNYSLKFKNHEYNFDTFGQYYGYSIQYLTSSQIVACFNFLKCIESRYRYQYIYLQIF